MRKTIKGYSVFAIISFLSGIFSLAFISFYIFPIGAVASLILSLFGKTILVSAIVLTYYLGGLALRDIKRENIKGKLFVILGMTSAFLPTALVILFLFLG